MATGITQGPYALTNGGTLSFNDPNVWGGSAATIQFQNATGFVIFVQTNGAGYNIQPFTNTTIPTNSGQTITSVATATGNVAAGNLYVVWLLEGQTPPIPDGPITVYAQSSHAISYTGASSFWVIGGSGQYFGTDKSISIAYQVNLNNLSPYLWLSDNSTSITYGPVLAVGLGLSSVAVFSFPNGIPNNSFTLYYGSNTAITSAVPTTRITITAAYASN